MLTKSSRYTFGIWFKQLDTFTIQAYSVTFSFAWYLKGCTLADGVFPRSLQNSFFAMQYMHYPSYLSNNRIPLNLSFDKKQFARFDEQDNFEFLKNRESGQNEI